MDLLENKKLPPRNSKNNTIKQLSKWLSHQKTNYKQNNRSMKDPNIRSLWQNFITSEQFAKYFYQLYKN